MPSTRRHSEYSRRSILKTAGGMSFIAGAITLGAGTSTAIPPCAVADGDDGDVTVYENCGTDPIAEVPNGETGDVTEACWKDDQDGEQYLYVVWDEDWTDGWVHNESISSCGPVPK